MHCWRHRANWWAAAIWWLVLQPDTKDRIISPPRAHPNNHRCRIIVFSCFWCFYDPSCAPDDSFAVGVGRAQHQHVTMCHIYVAVQRSKFQRSTASPCTGDIFLCPSRIRYNILYNARYIFNNVRLRFYQRYIHIYKKNTFTGIEILRYTYI